MSKDQKVKNSDKTESNGAGFDKTGSSVLSENVASFSPPPFSGASNGVGLLQKKENSDSVTEGSAQQNEHIVAPPPFSPTSSGLGTAQKKESNETGMNDGVKQKMESSFGTDFSDVNIHTNSNSAENLGALAYTQGTDIHFASGQFNQSSNSGQELLGHELSHVVQQKQGRVNSTHQEKGFSINDSNSLESEADSHGKIAASGGTINAGPMQQKAISHLPQVQKKNAPIQMARGDLHNVDENSHVQTMGTRSSYVCGLLTRANSGLQSNYGRPNWTAVMGPRISGDLQSPSYGIKTYTHEHDGTFNIKYTATISYEPAVQGSELDEFTGVVNQTQTDTSGASDSTTDSSGGKAGLTGGGASAELNSGTAHTTGSTHGSTNTEQYSHQRQRRTLSVPTIIRVTLKAEVSSSGINAFNPWQWGGMIGDATDGDTDTNSATGACVSIVHQTNYDPTAPD